MAVSILIVQHSEHLKDIRASSNVFEPSKNRRTAFNSLANQHAMNIHDQRHRLIQIKPYTRHNLLFLDRLLE